ncbi:MAG: hypothetical protein Q9225_005421 [Loekoesia sp. 1 TL-2023]
MFVRDQQDLHFIRKDLAAGLMRSCRLVRREAAPYFWGANHFRFSGQGGWQGLLRFLLTVGPAARRHITTIDVVAPYGSYWWPGNQVVGHVPVLDGRSKNDPRLRMAKLPHQKYDCRSTHIADVCEILVSDKTLQQLNLVVAGGCFERLSQAHVDKHEQLCLPAFTQVNLILEDGAYLSDRSAFPRVNNLEWNIICQPGSYVREQVDQLKARQFVKQQTWKHHKYSFLEGVPSLFGSPHEDFNEVDNKEQSWEGAVRIHECSARLKMEARFLYQYRHGTR